VAVHAEELLPAGIAPLQSTSGLDTRSVVFGVER
jgi:hypothetical protein